MKENEQLKKSNTSEDRYKQNYEKMNKLFNETRIKNMKLQAELERLNKKIEENKEKYKDYKMESLTLDYK